MMFKLLIGTVITAVVAGSILFIVWYTIDYKGYKSGCVGKIDFDRFLIFYDIQPKHWSLNNGYVTYDTWNTWGGLHFSIIDTFRYQKWRKDRNHKKEMNRNNAKYQEVLMAIQRDIKEYQEKIENGETSCL